MIRWPEKYFIPSERHRFLYIPIEKVACSSLKSWIVALEMGEEATRNVEIHGFARDNIELCNYSWFHARQLLADRSLFRFAFVRNPWDRLVSGFVQKFIHHVDSPAHQFLRHVERRRGWQTWLNWLTAGWLGELNTDRGRDLDSELTFREFVAELQHFSPADYDPHWRPQHLFLGDHDVDFIGRFERLGEDFAELKRKLGVGGSLPKINEIPRGKVTEECLADWPLSKLRTITQFPTYQQFYAADLAGEVAEIYAEDIRRFGYSFAEIKRTSRAA